MNHFFRHGSRAADRSFSPRALSALAWLLSAVLCSASGCCDSTPATAIPAGGGNPSQIESTSAIRFEDVTAASGVDSTYRNGREAEMYSILESLGGGTGAFDFDRDGLVDLFFTGGGGFKGKTIFGLPSRLYRNLTGDRFDNISSPARLVNPETYTQGCSMGDYDCDGYPDVLVTGYAGLQLFHNLGDGTFEEVHAEAQLTDSLWSSSAAWGDLNGDRLPDLYIAHYVDWSFENDPHCPSPRPEHDRDVCPPRTFNALPDVVYFNRGDGTFRDATADAQLRDDGKGLGVVAADFDHDLDLDVYVANDTVDNFMYTNDGHGRFAEAGLLTGTATDFEGKPNGSMGLAVCDYNGDLKPDLWVTNFERETFALYRNDGRAAFVHASREAGVTALGKLFVGFGTATGDFDCDGDEDAVVSNGHVVYYPTGSSERQLPILLENTGGGRFAQLESDAGEYFSTQHIGRGLVVADLNNDGRLDVVAGHSNEPAAVLMNASQPVGDWVRLRLVGRESARDAVGARIVLETAAREAGGDATAKQLRHVVGGGSFQSHNDVRVHFGFPAEAKPVAATIWWPSGTVQTVEDFTLNGTTIVVEKQVGSAR